jgi:c(7)-type cytochrome triheme protein
MLILLGGAGLAIVAGSAAAQHVIGDVVLDRRSTANEVDPVVFPHWKHRIRFKCYACHPDPFEMRAGANDISMDAMRQGQFCARCHNGQVAFPISFDTCRTCHPGPAQ